MLNIMFNDMLGCEEENGAQIDKRKRQAGMLVCEMLIELHACVGARLKCEFV